MSISWIQDEGVVFDSDGAGDGVEFGSSSLLADSGNNPAGNIKDQRHAYWGKLASGKYRIDVEQKPQPSPGSYNTDLYHIWVSLTDRFNYIRYDYCYGTHGRYGSLWSLDAFPSGSKQTTTPSGPAVIYEPSWPHDAQETFSTDSMPFQLSEPTKIYIEFLRWIGNVTWHDSGSDQRTHYDGINIFSLPITREQVGNEQRRVKAFLQDTSQPSIISIVISYLGG